MVGYDDALVVRVISVFRSRSVELARKTPATKEATRQSGCASQPVEELRHPKRCDALDEVGLEPFGPQALPEPKLACDRECRERVQIARGKPTLCRPTRRAKVRSDPRGSCCSTVSMKLPL